MTLREKELDKSFVRAEDIFLVFITRIVNLLSSFNLLEKCINEYCKALIHALSVSEL
jgi:hypothetical protein